jgi:type IV pilus assembly protein PilM
LIIISSDLVATSEFIGRLALTKHNDVQSTEKLLKLIRRQNGTPLGPEPDAGKTSAKNVSSITKAIRIRKKIAVGVDIGHTYIKLAKVQHISDKNHQLLDYLDLPFQKKISLKDPATLKLLKSKMEEFSGVGSNMPIWSAITSAKVETRCIHIPKLPAKQIHNAVYWTFTKKVSLDPNEEVLDYEILGDISDGGVKKTEIMVFKAPKEEIETLDTAFKKIGYPLSGISIVPFAIQNLFRTEILENHDEDVCCLFIGRDWSRIAIYSSGNLVLSRGIKAGMRSMIEAINLTLRQDATIDKNQKDGPTMARHQHNRASTIDPASQKLFFDFMATSTKTSDPSTALHGYTIGQVFQMIRPAMERLIRQIERTFEHYSMNFPNEGVRRVLISGPIISNQQVVDHIGKQLDLPIEVMNPFANNPEFSEPVNIPDGAASRESYVPSIGLALSTNQRTPNFLFTHQDKDKEERVRGNNMRVLTFCLLCLMVLIGIFSWQERRLDQKREAVSTLNSQLLSYNPPAEKSTLQALFSKTKEKRQNVKQMAVRYAPLAVVNELARLTPSHIRLLKLDTTFLPQPQKPGGPMGSLTLEGVVFGDFGTLETSLTSYLFGLRNSSIFDKPNILNKRESTSNGYPVLRFNIKIDLI